MKFFRTTKMKNIFAMLVSLSLSIGLWFYISTTKVGEKKFRIPIEFRSLKSDQLISFCSDKYVVASLTGNKEALSDVQVKNIKAIVDLGEVKEGEKQSYPLEIIRGNIPEGIEIIFSKKKIILTVEDKISRKVKVIPKVTGNVKKGNFLGEIKIDPQEIWIGGAKSVVSKIDSINTQEISVEKKEADISKEVNVDRAELGSVTLSRVSVKVFIPIMKYEKLYTFEVPLVLKNIKKDYTYIFEKSNVKIYLKLKDESKQITDQDILAFIDVGGVSFKKKKGKLPIIKKMPVKIEIKKNQKESEIISFFPERVEINITKKKNTSVDSQPEGKSE